MNRRQALADRWSELGPFLQRRFWRPLRNSLDIFHVLPLVAALILFVLLATDGQFREIYIAYLEGPHGDAGKWVASIGAAAAVLALLSAVLCEAHYSLSTMRINVVYSSYSNPDANSTLHSLQRTAAFVLAFFPWLGVGIGLFSARNFVADRYCQLLSQMPDAHQLHDMQHLLAPGGWTIAAALIFLGAATASFSCVEQKTRIAQRAVALIAPPLGALLFLLFTDWLIPSIRNWLAILFCALIFLATIFYFMVYQWLYRRRGGPIFSRSPRSNDDADADAAVDLPRSRAGILVTWLLWPLPLIIAHPEFSTGISLRKRRRQMLIAWAFLPWLFTALYFVIVPYFTPPAQAADLWPQCPVAGTYVPVPGHWTIFPIAMCFTIGVGLLVGLVLNRLSDRWMLRRVVIVSLVAALAVAAFGVSTLELDTFVRIYRLIGPLGTAALQLLFLISTFAVLAWLSQRSGFPALTLVVLAIVICVMFPNYVAWAALALAVVSLMFAIPAFLSGLVAVGCIALVLPILGIIQWSQLRTEPVEQIHNKPFAGGVDPLSVKFKFECWLGERGISVQDPDAAKQLNQICPEKAGSLGSAAPSGRAGQKYPVFLIAAEGGGIYAASAASMFLARLQEASPRFAEHVFAISGVSGGAIGSTIFQALDKAASEKQQSTAASEPLTQEMTNIMEDDHLSPVVGSIFAEILGSSTTRDRALVASFEVSASTQDKTAGKILSSPFMQHWAYDDGAPALVLNATWVETGYRVAFAPFHLHSIDESLYSFSDESMPDEGCPSKPDVRSCVSLLEAAAVSARFPLVLPPFSTEMVDRKRWNFVDGGYADNSGATTALDFYRTLKNVAPQDVDLKVILITSATPQPDLTTTEISGTAFRDTIAPIDALMKVRADLGNDAVARACSEVYQNTANPQSVDTGGAAKNDHTETNQTCIGHAGDPKAALQIVEIQDQTYGLSLGWKISQTSFEVVSWMLGQPQDCHMDLNVTSGVAAPTAKVEGTSQKEIVQRNNCVLKSIIDSVEN